MLALRGYRGRTEIPRKAAVGKVWELRRFSASQGTQEVGSMASTDFGTLHEVGHAGNSAPIELAIDAEHAQQHRQLATKTTEDGVGIPTEAVHAASGGNAGAWSSESA